MVGKLTDECLFVAFRKNGKVVDAAGLEQPAGDAKPTLAVGEADGGTYETWRIVSQLEPAYGAVATRFTAGTLAINHLAAGMLDAVAWVTNPANADHKLLRATLADPALSIFGIADASLVSPETYESRELKIPGVGSIRTICTSTMIFSGPGTPKRVVDGVSDVLSLQRDELLAEP